MEKVKFKLHDNSELFLFSNDSVFRPNLTSQLIIKTLSTIKIQPGKKILDLGCGSGVISIALHKKGLIKKAFCSDMSEEAVKIAKYNLRENNIKSDVRKGSVFEPWVNSQFDIIIDDISGVSSSVINYTDWFKMIPCESGIDGTELTLNVLNNAKKFLVKNGFLLFPVISLSDEKKIIDFAKNKFKKVYQINSIYWPMPKSLQKEIKLLEMLKKQNHINYESKFGILYCSTKIFLAGDENET